MSRDKIITATANKIIIKKDGLQDLLSPQEFISFYTIVNKLRKAESKKEEN